jgi:hypothetical protein
MLTHLKHPDEIKSGVGPNNVTQTRYLNSNSQIQLFHHPVLGQIPHRVSPTDDPGPIAPTADMHDTLRRPTIVVRLQHGEGGAIGIEDDADVAVVVVINTAASEGDNRPSLRCSRCLELEQIRMLTGDTTRYIFAVPVSARCPTAVEVHVLQIPHGQGHTLTVIGSCIVPCYPFDADHRSEEVFRFAVCRGCRCGYTAIATAGVAVDDGTLDPTLAIDAIPHIAVISLLKYEFRGCQFLGQRNSNG